MDTVSMTKKMMKEMNSLQAEMKVEIISIMEIMKKEMALMQVKEV